MHRSTSFFYFSLACLLLTPRGSVLVGQTDLEGASGLHQNEDENIFRTVLRRPGDDGSKAFRIPGLATTTSGALLAVFDIRYEGSGDLPADIDVGLMRSVDAGNTWSPMQRILDFDKSAPDSFGNGVGDPTILVDRQTGAIFVAALCSHGNRGWKGSGPGMSPEETGQLVMTKSTDDGLTWSQPLNLTRQVKEPEWRLCFNGPGAGIQLSDGTLVIPAQYRESDGTAHACFLYSCDHGDNWIISPPAIPTSPPTSESQIAELDDGSLLLSMRDESRSGTRAWAKWTWNNLDRTKSSSPHTPGIWSDHWSVVNDPTCMASLLKHPNGKLLFSNPNHPSKRIALTIRFSDDEGRNWSDGRLVDSGECMYSCMTVLDNGDIGILYEVNDMLAFARFTFGWVSLGESSK